MGTVFAPKQARRPEPSGRKPAPKYSLGGFIRPLLALIFLLGVCLAQAQTPPSVTVSPASPGIAVRTRVEALPREVVVLVDGKLVNAEDVEVQRGSQVMVWLRELEKLGWGAIETGPTDQVRFQGKGVILAFTKGQGVARVNSLAVRLPVDTYLKDGKLMVPLSFVAKALGFDYEVAPKTVVSIRTNPASRVATNSIIGRVLYDDRGVPGVLVRAVDADFTVVKNVTAKTDPEGSFTLSPLPDGKFMAYVYTGDNPRYFNRASEIVELKAGQQAQVGSVVLGRIIAPLHPKPGSKVSLGKSHLEFSWTSCPGAATYKLSIKRRGNGAPVLEAVSNKSSTQVPSAKLSAGARYDVEVTATATGGAFLGGTAGAGGEAWTFTAAK